MAADCAIETSTAAAVPRRRVRRSTSWVLLIAVVAGGAVLVSRELVARRERARLMAGLHAEDAAKRAWTCRALAVVQRDNAEAANEIVALLQQEADPEVCESGAYALMKMGDARAPEAIVELIERLPEHPAVAKLIVYHARVQRPAPVDELRGWAASGATWREIGAGAGLLEAGMAEGAAVLLRHAGSEDEYVRAHAADYLRRISGPVMDMVGQSTDLATAEGRGFSVEQLAAVGAFWRERDRTRELRDYQTWLRHEDPQWHEVQRLLHARKRANRVVGVGEAGE